MNPIADKIRDVLNDDILNNGLLAQLLDESEDIPRPTLEGLLTELLSSGGAEVGSTRLARVDYVGFIAWKGSVEERVARAIEAVGNSEPRDRAFAFWLCLRKNVDRFED